MSDNAVVSRPGISARHAPYLFISPFFVLYTLFMIVPIGFGLYLSLTEWAGLGTPVWVGLRNYGELLNDPSFWTALKNTAVYVVFVMLVVLPTALLLALGMNAKGLKLRDTFRAVFFLPVVVSPIVIALIFGLFFDQQYGLVNGLLQAVFGFGGIEWLTSPTWAKVVVVILVLWRWTGYLTIFFLAGLQNVPRELYESASIDGAGAALVLARDPAAAAPGRRVRGRHLDRQLRADLRGTIPADQRRAGRGHDVDRPVHLPGRFPAPGVRVRLRGRRGDVRDRLRHRPRSVQLARDGEDEMTTRSRPLLLVTLTVVALFWLFPLIWAFFSSFKARSDLFGYPPRLLPADWTTASYSSLLDGYPFWSWFLFSTVIAVVATVITVFVCALAGFGFAKYEFRGKAVLFDIMFSSMAVPFAVIVIPLFIMLAKTGLASPWFALIVPGWPRPSGSS